MKGIIIGIMIASAALVLVGKPAPHVRQAIVADWTQHHILYPDSSNPFLVARTRGEFRWVQNWYLRHPAAWWPGQIPPPNVRGMLSHRDWSVPLAAATPTSGFFEPVFDYSLAIIPDTGYGSLNAIDEGNGEFLATAGTLTVTSLTDAGTYSLYPGGPAQTTSPSGYFYYDNLLFPSGNPEIDNAGLLFTGHGLEINLFSNGPGNYQFYVNTGYNHTDATGEPFIVNPAPGGGQTFPSKFVFDVNAAPSCASDFVVIGIPANPASGGQANIVGVNNLYSTQGASLPAPLCGTSGPTVKFAYASGTGQVPAGVIISGDGTQLAYIENLLTGSSYFHVLTLGTTGTNGSSATAAVVPGAAGGNNAVDQSVLLSPPTDPTVNQSSTNSVFVDYFHGVAYATTYSWAGGGSGYVYKLGNVFNGSATPTIVWSAPVSAVPSTPVYDFVSNKVFFTDSQGHIDYVLDSGASPSVTYSSVLASGATSENPVTIDSTNQMVYAFFNSNGTSAVVVQAPTSMASSVSVAVGAGSTTYTGPYGVDFNNDFYIGSGTPLMYVAGTGTGTLPTLYSVGFNGSGVMNSSVNTATALASDMADSSSVSEFYNAASSKDYLFVGVTNNCAFPVVGGAGCVMSFDISSGTPIFNAALAAPGGTSGIIVDNDSSATQASNIYYATKTGVTLVKATQAGLN